jgi:hypothetical protein
LINCGKSISGEGDCDNVLTCEGDAIVCAGIKLQKDGLCAWERSKMLSDLHDFAQLEGLDGPMPLVVPGDLNEDVDVGDIVGNFLNDETPVGGSCPPDIEVPLMRGTVTIGIQPICDFALVLQPYVILIGTFWGCMAFIRIGFMR